MNNPPATLFFEFKKDRPSLLEAQKFLGGYVEIVCLDNDQLLVNEEGALLNLPLNIVASTMAGREIYGPAILLVDDARWD